MFVAGSGTVTGDYVELDGESYYKISNSHLMPEFFMSLVGASDHWMFISSHGALTAGRQNSDLSLFPYSSDDQISAARSTTGVVTRIRVGDSDGWEPDYPSRFWEPFAPHPTGPHQFHRHLYKTPLGNKLILEEVNETLNLTFRYRWAFSEKSGFVRTCQLENFGNAPLRLDLLDGLRNVLPHGLGAEFQMRFSNLGNAYKKSELTDQTGIGIFYLSSVPTDRAEPSEGLLATTVWQSGLSPAAVLLSDTQLANFDLGAELETESDVRGKASAYLLNQPLELRSGERIEWHIVAEVAQDHCDIIALHDELAQTQDQRANLEEDIRNNERELSRILSSSDAFQCSENRRRTSRHLSNTVFNVMRGGIPLESYRVHRDDFSEYLCTFNLPVFQDHKEAIAALPQQFIVKTLRSFSEATGDADLIRIAAEYLPLAFSRRHGDPTRPWNHFSIDLRSPNGRTNLNYQGNWRDIFQNWEALGMSFPEFLPSMIGRFVNATTADGYNPYRVTRSGFEWEVPEPDSPWANIGYWGDHQIIYLLRLLESARDFAPDSLDRLLTAGVCVHANIPYRIGGFEEVREAPQDTIRFDQDLADIIAERVKRIGSDGKLLRNQQDEIHHVTLLEKLLTLSLAKMSNFIPDGGIWLNTQRPEWNDANNALVGNGLSMVTACYLHRWFTFLHAWIAEDSADSFEVSREVADFFKDLSHSLTEHPAGAEQRLSAEERGAAVEALSRAGCTYRNNLYGSGLSGQMVTLEKSECLHFFNVSRHHLRASIINNQRLDGLYHAYNLIRWTDSGVEVDPLYEMLEGQVAVLSSGMLSPQQAILVLDALRKSSLYRANQDSYMLYPDRRLPSFLAKNQLHQQAVDDIPLLVTLLEDGEQSVVLADVHGDVHFNGTLRNSTDLQSALDNLDDKYQPAVKQYRDDLTEMYDDLFNHRQFTGRSGTFFAYEGLGSIYWHMVSKLGLAVAELYFDAVRNNSPGSIVGQLQAHFIAIQQGIGAEKTPAQYGAFPSDPYSHTPENAGAKQPGMTGQVKEDILARFAEIGVKIESGRLSFRLDLFDRNELVSDDSGFTICDLEGKFRTIQVPKSGFGFTLCQVPIVYRPAQKDLISVHFNDGRVHEFSGCEIDEKTSRRLFARSGEIIKIECQFRELTTFDSSR